MAAWQADQGYEPSGILTTRQRAELLDSYQGIFAALGLRTVRDTQAGIEMQLPMAMIARGDVEPPFIRYERPPRFHR